MTQRSDSTDGRPVPRAIGAEIERLATVVDAHERTIRELEATVAQLQTALDSRVPIERALGILAERFDLSIPEAFELLRAAARASRRPLTPLAEEVVASRRLSPSEVVEAFRRLAAADHPGRAG